MLSVPSILVALLTLTSWTFATDAPRSVRQPREGKAFYTVYPSESISVSTTEDFVKKTVGTDGLLPSTDDSNNFVSWIVEASPAEVDVLKSNTAINRVVHFDPPEQRDDDTVVRQLAERDDDVQTFAVFPVDRANADQCAETEKFMKGLIKDDYYPHAFVFKNQTYYWTLRMTNAQRDEVAKGPGIRRIEADHKAELTRAMPPDPSPVAQLSDSRVMKRELQYSTQKDVVSELKFVSQPTSVPDLNKLANYVYESHQGEGCYIYHLELGVAFKSQASEFPNVVPDEQHLQTDKAKRQNWKPWEEHADKAHGTCTADKAVGAKYGSSKKARLVVVQIGELTLLEINEAIRKIMDDVTDKADRKKKSVVSMSMKGDLANPDSDIQELLEESLQELFALDVPVITGSGNDRKTEPDVDTVPAQWARPEYPLIVVGSVDFDGKRSDFSQGGTQVSIHAPGRAVTCMPESGDVPSTGRSGTSYSTPLVAGEVANLLSYETVPFDTSDGNLVKNLRQYLTEKGSWKRVGEETAIWNGVDEVHNPTVAGAGGNSDGGSGDTPPPLHKECTGLGSKKYVTQPELKRLIEDEFCPAAVKQGTLDPGSAALMRPYNDGTADAVVMAIEWQPGVQFTPNLDDCNKYLLQEITDGCDGNDPKNNPENFKGGGFFSVGDVTYRITPTALRQPPGNGKKGGCDCTYNFADTTCVIWGGGWSSADWGSALKNQLGGCALYPTGWTFDYGLGDDGREWTAHAETGIGQRDCVGHAGVSAGGPADFVCHGNG